MTEKDLDIAIEKCERIMEFDTRTLKNPESENGWIFEKVYELLQYLRQFQFVPDTNVGDMISRQAALDAMMKLQTEDIEAYGASIPEGFDGDRAVTALKALPSAQPNLDEWCDDCKEYDKERHCCPRWNRVIRQTVDDVKKERKPCNGCKHMGNDFKCNRCVRAAQDNYEPWEGGQDERFD